MSIIRKTKTSNIDTGFNCVLSDMTPDHYDDVVGLGWVIDNFKKNPIALFNHDKDFPIGRWENVRIENGALRGRLVMAPMGTSPRIDELLKLIKAGVLRAISVGFKPIESAPRKSGGRHYLKQELVEASLVCVPANPSALMEAKALGVSTATIKMVFKEGNKNASLADRIAHARYSQEEMQRIHRKAKAMVAKHPKLLTMSKDAKKEFDRQERKAAILKRAKAEVALMKKEGKPVSKEEKTYVVWRGIRIPVPKWRGEDQW